MEEMMTLLSILGAKEKRKKKTLHTLLLWGNEGKKEENKKTL